MSAEKVWNWTEFTSKADAEKFLPYSSWWKNHAPHVHGSTLYENLKYLHDLGELEYEFGGRQLYSRKHYEFTPYELFYDWFATPESAYHVRNLQVFKALNCYQLKGLYNFPESMTIGEVKANLLIPLVDKLLLSGPILATTMFINRMSTELVSLEFFIFCTAELDPEVLEDLLFSSYLIRPFFKPIDSQDSNFWFYRYYCEIFLNSNILNGTCRIISFSTKPLPVIAEILTNFMKDKAVLPEGVASFGPWAAVFDLHLNGQAMDWLSGLSYIYDFKRFLQYGKARGYSNPDDCFLLQQDIWNPNV